MGSAMTKTFTLRTAVAVALAGIVGTLLNAVAVAIVITPERIALALVPGRYVVAILLCLPLPLLLAGLQRPWFVVLGTLWLTVAASGLAKLVFSVAAPWPTVLGFNLIYAIGAVTTYWIIAGRGANRARRSGPG